MNVNKPARWFRMYAEFSSDPKVQMLSEVLQRRYIMVLCLRCGNGDVTLQDSEVAFQLRIDVTEWVQTKAVFLEKNLITEDNQPTAWDKRQFASDSSAERVAEHRRRKKEACNVTVTPPETEKEKEKETEKEEKTKAVAVAKQPLLTPDGVSNVVFQDFVKLRKGLKAPVTETAIKRLATEAKKAGMSLQEVMELCCQNGWRGFNADWILKNKPKNAGERNQDVLSGLTRGLLGGGNNVRLLGK